MFKNRNVIGKGFDKYPEHINKNGRPRKLPELDKLLAEVLGSASDDTSPAKEILIKLIAIAKKGDVRAAEVLLDRAYGKVKQPIGLSGEVSHPSINMSKLTPEEQDQFISLQRKAKNDI